MTTDPPCIAVVDDEAPVRTMLRRVLALAGYDVLAFGNGEDFLQSLATRIPDGAVLDIHMPGLSGLEVHHRLSALHDAIPVVFITASDDPSLDAIVAREHGAKLLRKPFPTDELLDALAERLPPVHERGA